MLREKCCKDCGETKLICCFYKHSETKDGHLSSCKECVKKRVKEYRKRNIKKIKAYDKKRKREDKKNNPEKTEKFVMNIEQKTEKNIGLIVL